ncbi:MAG: cytochrome d ubiquinol oxidase subunit II [Polyangia bacterium]
MSDPSALQTTWFVLFGVLVAGYAVLDGFDLGAGALSLMRREPSDRDLIARAIGPVWDGNEVWLITAGGALFAAFPPVYAAVFSGFYLAVLLLLLALIGRAVALEFRGQLSSPRWRLVWDRVFGAGSALATLLLGTAVGNVMQGAPLDASGEIDATFLSLLNPYAIAAGLLALASMTCQGAIYISLKSEGRLHREMRSAASSAWVGWVLLWVGMSVGTFFVAPHLLEGALGRPTTWIALAAVLAGLVATPIALRSDRLPPAFVASSSALVGMVGLVGAGLYPRFVPATGDLSLSLTIAESSSSDLTLWAMLIIALIGMPLVIVYQAFIHRTFRGKVSTEDGGY